MSVRFEQYPQERRLDLRSMKGVMTVKIITQFGAPGVCGYQKSWHDIFESIWNTESIIYNSIIIFDRRKIEWMLL